MRHTSHNPEAREKNHPDDRSRHVFRYRTPRTRINSSNGKASRKSRHRSRSLAESPPITGEHVMSTSHWHRSSLPRVQRHRISIKSVSRTLFLERTARPFISLIRLARCKNNLFEKIGVRRLDHGSNVQAFKRGLTDSHHALVHPHMVLIGESVGSILPSS